MAKSPLPSAELLRKLLEYDPETGNLTWRERPREMFVRARLWKTWNTRWAAKPAFTANHGGYKWGSVLGADVLAHRLIWAFVTGEWPDCDIDHINGDRSNNRWANLRKVSRSVNMRNARLKSNNTSGVNGVSWDREGRRWLAQMWVAGKYIHIGRFADIADAIAARKAAEAAHGFTERHGT